MAAPDDQDLGPEPLALAEPCTIRPAQPQERPLLIDLQRRASQMWEEDRDALLAHPDAIDVPASQIAEGRVFVCEAADGRLAGFGVVLPRDDGSAELDGLFVEPTAWGRGIGRRLAAHAEVLAREAGCTALNVVANQRAAGFYAACGFVAEGEVATAFNPAVAMRRGI